MWFFRMPMHRAGPRSGQRGVSRLALGSDGREAARGRAVASPAARKPRGPCQRPDEGRARSPSEAGHPDARAQAAFLALRRARPRTPSAPASSGSAAGSGMAEVVNAAEMPSSQWIVKMSPLARVPPGRCAPPKAWRPAGTMVPKAVRVVAGSGRTGPCRCSPRCRWPRGRCR